MGLRTASVRHPHVEVMAPALTESSQNQSFNLPPKGQLEPESLIDNYEENKQKLQYKQSYFKSKNNGDIDHPYVNGEKSYNLSESVDEKPNLNKCLNEVGVASDIVKQNINIMNISPTSMGDQSNEMGLQKTSLDIPSIHKEKVSSDMDQLFNSLSAVLPESENACTSDLAPEDIMQVIKSIEGNDRLNTSSNDLNSENEEIFPMPGTDLTNNLTTFEKELLENVDDVMNMTIEDQQDDLDTVDKQKESQANEVLKELQMKHSKVERRLDFLRRRVYKLQSRMMGQHISGEIAGVFENIQRLLKKQDAMKQDSLIIGGLPPPSEIGPPETAKPLSLATAKTLVKKLEMTAILQANSVARQKTGSKYFGSGSVEVPTFRNNLSGMINIAPWPLESKSELQKVSGQLKSQLSIVQDDVDSEATESSSGGESCDEMHSYNNPHQQYLSVQKRALWKYSTDRAVIAARWTWLQAQISDLEYRIRQHTDLHKTNRSTKGSIQLGGESPPHTVPSPQTTVNGYRGQLPGNSPISTKSNGISADGAPQEYQCARTRPLVSFKKRKLLQVSGLHAVSKKAARPSTVRCGCVSLSEPCATCTGRTDSTYPRDPPDTLSRSERVALLDSGFHPVFSMAEDVSQNIHLEAVMKTTEWQHKSSRMKSVKAFSKMDRLETKSLEHRTKKLEHRKKYGRLLKPSTMSALSAKIKNKIRGRKPGRHPLHRKRSSEKDVSSQLNALPTDCHDEEVESIENNSSNPGLRSLDSPSSSPLLQMQSISGYNKKNRIDSYDIDNIVIPYSVAASTRVEKLQYKEILTPKWRIAESDYDSLFDKNTTIQDPSQDSDAEDLTEDSVIVRHDKCEHEEKKRFLSYLKLPMGYGRPRANRRTDSRAESSGANTPDPMSPHNMDLQDSTNSPMTSPPATPLSIQPDDNVPLPSIAVLRRRTMSQSKLGKEFKEETAAMATDVVEVVAPYEKRLFPISEDVYDKMLKSMPENHQFQTNTRSQDSLDNDSYVSYLDQKIGSPGSESTESAIGDAEEDPNDPEWIDMERANRERYKR